MVSNVVHCFEGEKPPCSVTKALTSCTSESVFVFLQVKFETSLCNQDQRLIVFHSEVSRIEMLKTRSRSRLSAVF